MTPTECEKGPQVYVTSKYEISLIITGLIIKNAISFEKIQKYKI